MNILDLAILKKLGGGGGGTGGANIDVSAEVGQTIIVKEVDTNGKPTKWESADYQPRTHWAEVAELLPNTTATFLEEDGVFVVMDCAFEFAIGNSYTISWNGVSYTCVADNLIGSVGVGNARLLDGSGDTGEPFFISVAEGMLVCIPFDGSNELTVGVIGEMLERIDKKYLPMDTLYNNSGYSKLVFDLVSYCAQEGFVVSGVETDGFENTSLTEKHFAILKEAFENRYIYLVLFDTCTRAIAVEDWWEINPFRWSSFSDSLEVSTYTLRFRWSDEDNCVQYYCKKLHSHNIQLSS